MLTKGNVNFIIFKNLKCLPTKNARNNKINHGTSNKIARLQHYRTNSPRLQNIVGKIVIFGIQKHSGKSQDNRFVF